MALTAPIIRHGKIDTVSSGDNVIVAAVTGKKIRITSYLLIPSAAVSLTWKSDSDEISGTMDFAALGGAAPTGNAWAPLLETAEGAALKLNLSAAVQVSGHVAYFEE
jgi:hypothetical protein